MAGTAKSEKYSELIQALQKFNQTIMNASSKMKQASTVAQAAMGNDQISQKNIEAVNRVAKKYLQVVSQAQDLAKKLTQERQKVIEIENEANNFNV